MNMHHAKIINYLINKYNYKTYLEIGVYRKDCFNQINVEYKECCDTKDWLENNDITYLMTSDEMFNIMPTNKKYDIIFIDGLHTEQQLDRDIINSLKHLNKGGLVLCHDTLPSNNFAAYNDYIHGVWSGTCFKSICKLNNENIEFYTVDNGEFGLTIIKYCDNPYNINIDKYYSNQTYENLFKHTLYNFEDLLDNNVLMNNFTEQGKFTLHIISINEFLNIF